MDSDVQAAAAPTERREQIAGMEIFWREAPCKDGVLPTLYVHGVPTNADQWTPFLELTGGAALDLPGFGRSDKPMHFDGSLAGYNAFLQAFIAQQGWDRFNLVVSGWGSLALITAQEMHRRIARLVLINPVPLLPGYRWHRLARIWRTPLVGELSMGLTTKSLLGRVARETRPSKEPLPAAMIDSIWDHFDQGTQRAILKLHRGAPSKLLEQAGEGLTLLDAPALVIWGEQDPCAGSAFGELYASTLPDARLELLTDAGHWPWLDRPEVIEMTADFVTSDQGRAGRD